jgi:hypothetical protein
MLDAGGDGVALGGKRGSVMLHPETVVADLALTMLLGFAGAVGAWVLRRRTTLSARNRYPPAAVGALSLAGAIGLSAWNAALVLLPLVSPWLAGAVVGARWRSSDLGAGEELRNHELGRRWIWQPSAGPRRRAAVPALAGRAGPRTAMAAVARLRVDDFTRRGRPAAAAGGRTARGAVRRDRCR